jgi:hypothetical protein
MERARAYEDWDEVADILAREASPADGVVFFGEIVRVPVEYQLRDRLGQAPTPIHPSAAWGDEEGRWLLDDETEEDAPDQIRTASMPILWVVTSPDHSDDAEAVEGALEADRVVGRQWKGTRTVVTEWVHP